MLFASNYTRYGGEEYEEATSVGEKKKVRFLFIIYPPFTPFLRRHNFW